MKREREKLPFQPIRSELYTSTELSQGFDPKDPECMMRMADFQTFNYFVKEGRATPSDPYAGMMEALHDNSILQSMFDFLTGRDRVAAIMGGHREQRGSSVYRAVVALAKRLTEEGFLMASGGGPGAMEATHLGALMAGKESGEVEDAIGLLMTQPTLPLNASDVVKVLPDGSISVDKTILAALHKWSAPAHELMARIAKPGESLAVPTWHYGHEPVTPLASHAAKYFQNSVREDVLLLLAAQGIIFAEGRAGTVQEIFQDAAQNYYPAPDAGFSPMIFFNHNEFWTKTLPVKPLLEGLFILGKRDKEFAASSLFTEDLDEIVKFLTDRVPNSKVLFDERARQLGMRALQLQAV
ncbi:hypothetical protein HP062_18060 [Pseudomonas sp. B14-6]|uniref:LOG family protein n=1 Tax=Pseudomonas sp. B14-6 TaxID=2738843 RepID=UPI00155E212E|nr:hypothetical protein [Pseudomonas sp. B14-6]QKG67330.1 hypothetical protein HP062_18060 [Pseudomonas sp. B14-6]